LRDKPKPSGKSLKKEVKGAKVTLEALDGGWAKVTDGNIRGWMRSSVLGVNPPETN
jgi:SH3-like domain-containing protein